MARNYIPTLRLILREICRYIGVHRDTIVRAVGSENADKVDAVINHPTVY